MVLNTDGKNINGYIIYDEDNYWPLELTSEWNDLFHH
jgi:hypothetical protein